jgi:pimeloyl-ACP methyl ester carboxylesterase
MQNLSETGSYTLLDHAVSKAVWSISRFIGVTQIMSPFWNRWRASLIGESTLREFLGNIRSLADWPSAANDIVRREELELRSNWDQLSLEKQIERMRRLSFLAHLAQWGSIPIDDIKRDAYRKSRDYYIEAERLAYPDRYRRIQIDWKGSPIFGNLHVAARPRSPLIVVLHGMDDTKEEHLSTELCLVEAGFSVLTIDGPGQGEALFIDGRTWPPDFHRVVSAAIDAVADDSRIDVSRVGLVGISWGGFWAYKAAAVESRVRAIFDLGGPIDAARFKVLPFFLKSKFCQALGASGPEEVPEADTLFSLRHSGIIENVGCDVRIVHGDRDPIVKVKDKVWLFNELQRGSPARRTEMEIVRGGDHCCTGAAQEVRAGAVSFFAATL